MRELVKQMGADGWLGIGWPKEYGGQGRGPIEQFIFFDESMRAGAPVPMLTINTVGPTIMQFGTQEQKDFFLPKILAGEIHFCIGYTEPGAGTDLAVAAHGRGPRRRRVRHQRPEDVDLARQRRRLLLARRPHRPGGEEAQGHLDDHRPDGHPRHHGPAAAACSGEHDITAVYYDDVRVPVENLVGGENNGWRLITNQLNHERVTLCSSGMVEPVADEVRRWAQQTRLPDGRRVIDQEWVQLNLARGLRRPRVPAARQLEGGLGRAAQASLDIADASTIKVFGTEFYMEAFRLLMEIIGEAAYLKDGSPGAVLGSRLEGMYRGLVILTFGGGANEVQRDLIAMFGLGLPMAKR